MIGQKFKNWLVLKQVSSDKRGRLFECRCECGNIRLLNAYQLNSKEKYKHCRHCYHKDRTKKAYSHFPEKRFGNWFVLKRNDNGKPFVSFECQCICGKISIVAAGKLKNGLSKQCDACQFKEYAFKETHGKTLTPIYSVWVGMRQRCSNKNSAKYKDYGGRGIKVCQRWEKFENFLLDMGEKPPRMQLDRIDNDGDYEPVNCRWASAFENAENRRNSAKYKDLYISGTFKKDLFCADCLEKIKKE